MKSIEIFVQLWPRLGESNFKILSKPGHQVFSEVFHSQSAPAIRFPFQVVFFVALIGILFSGFPFSTNLFAQDRAIEVTEGETVVINQPVETTFHTWDLIDFSTNILRLLSDDPPDTIGMHRYIFEAVAEGDGRINYELVETTALYQDVIQTREINVRVSPEPEAPPEPEPQPVTREGPSGQVSEPERERRAELSPLPPRGEFTREPSAGVDRQAWEHVLELLEQDQFAAAREIITDELRDAFGESEQTWRNKLAESFVMEEEYDFAAATWAELINDFPDGPRARWHLMRARAFRAMEDDGQAELDLLQVKHRHRETPAWPEALIELGEIARDRDNLERARQSFELARQALEGEQSPHLILRLAELYDRYAPIRDFERAVRLYRQAGNLLAEVDPDLAREAIERSNHLVENYVQFGAE